MRKCPNCKEEKEISEFYLSKNGKPKNPCKECTKAYELKRRELGLDTKSKRSGKRPVHRENAVPQSGKSGPSRYCQRCGTDTRRTGEILYPVIYAQKRTSINSTQRTFLKDLDLKLCKTCKEDFTK
jgi:hypothetical protein|tara:strand:+ start:359 stop:736 length:378 start_codon:yes stop_codon:yes gene_type:complete